MGMDDPLSPSKAGHGDPGGYAIDPGNGNGSAPIDPEARALAAELRVLETNVLLARAAFARATGFTFGDKRDMYGVLGYPELLSTSDYRAKYDRGGIAGRIVDAMPDACWRGSMEIIEDESKEKYTEFEQAWADLDKRLQIQAKLQRVDRLAGLSTYAVLLIGAGDKKPLEQELSRVAPTKDSSKQLLYLTPFSGGGGPASNNVQADRTIAAGADASIAEYDTDVSSPRFGLPKSYLLKRIAADGLQKPVHWSRIIHVAEGLLDDEVYGQPSLQRVWNLILDLEKVTGGGSEAFWLRANQGMHVNLNKDMALPDVKDTVAALKEQVEAYKHGLDRWIRTRGADVNVLGSDVANFASPADAILTQIAGAKKMPKRILTGSEMGELASSQDRDNWKDQVNGRQTGYLAPYLVRPLVDRLVAYGYLPAPKKGTDAYEVRWPHIQTLTEQEKAEGASKWAQTVVAEDPVFTDAEIRDKWYGMAPLSDEQRQEIADRKAEKVKQAQEAMGGQQPAEEEDGVLPQLVRAASAWEPQPGDEELVLILAEAIEAGNADVVGRIVGLGDLPGHEFHGNQWVDAPMGVHSAYFKGENRAEERKAAAREAHRQLTKAGYVKESSEKKHTPSQKMGRSTAYSGTFDKREANYKHPDGRSARMIERWSKYGDHSVAVHHDRRSGPTLSDDPKALSIAPMHKSLNGAALCGQRAAGMFLTGEDQDVTCVKCLEVMRG